MANSLNAVSVNLLFTASSQLMVTTARNGRVMAPDTAARTMATLLGIVGSKTIAELVETASTDPVWAESRTQRLLAAHSQEVEKAEAEAKRREAEAVAEAIEKVKKARP